MMPPDEDPPLHPHSQGEPVRKPEGERTPRFRDERAESQLFVQRIHELADLLLADATGRGDIKLIWRTVFELRESFKLLSKYRSIRKVTVFGSARIPSGAPLYDHAVAFGKAMSEAGFMVITGAGPGIMEAGHVGAGAAHSIGINIVLPFEQGANQIIANDEKLINLHYFFTRKLLFLKETDALVLFPGGFGTLDEGFETLTLIQTGKAPLMPIVMLDVPGGCYWDEWRDYVDRCLYRAGLISKEDFSLFSITDSVEKAVEEIVRFYRVYHSQRYVRGRLFLRLKRPLGDALMERIRHDFSDLLERGDFKQGVAHHHEANEPHVADLPRLYFYFNRKSPGRLRELIDLINREA